MSAAMLKAFFMLCGISCVSAAAENCNGYALLSGLGYLPHESECNKYRQCQILEGGAVVKKVRTCPHGLFWNQDILTCDYPANVKCENDKCQDEDYYYYKAEHAGCRAYYKCHNSYTESGECCDLKYRFDEDKGECVYDKHCTDSCQGKHALAPAPAACPLKEVKGKPHIFLHDGIERPCAPGTTFSLKQCTCVHKPVVHKPVCRKELNINFNNGVRDETGNYVDNLNVGVTSRGKGNFTGESRLNIPRFTNIDLPSTMYIHFEYNPANSAALNDPVVLLAFGNCRDQYSLVIQSDTEYDDKDKEKKFLLRIAVRTTTGQKKFITLPADSSWNDVNVIIYEGSLIAFVNDKVDYLYFSGSLARSNCALLIGSGYSYDYFKGRMDDIKVAFCIPDEFHEFQHIV